MQSTAMYFMSSLGDLPRADYAIFADPGAEKDETYDLLDYCKKWAEENNGIPIVVNNDKNLYKDIMNGTNSTGQRFASIPAFSEHGGITRRQCTREYKIAPVIKSARTLHGLKPRQRMKPTEMWLGISMDEMQRMKESQFYNVEYKYPLIEKRLRRVDCLRYLKEKSFPKPERSACVFCPYQTNKEWAKIQENKKYWGISIKIDKQIRNLSQKGEKDRLYLHNYKKPLEDIDFTDNQLDMFEGFDLECDGVCGL